ncbi:MAG TPA: hypothetical protein PKD21_07630 [Candidatus Competibacter phosphatis]|nr:hypothetical protein [Candidatus Competibacter phosphatis]
MAAPTFAVTTFGCGPNCARLVGFDDPVALAAAATTAAATAATTTAAAMMGMSRWQDERVVSQW